MARNVDCVSSRIVYAFALLHCVRAMSLFTLTIHETPTTSPPIPADDETPATESPPTREAVPTPFGCHYNGKIYPPGQTVTFGEDKIHNVCGGLVCDEQGRLGRWEAYGCRATTTTPPPTLVTATPSRLMATPLTPKTTVPPTPRSPIVG